MSPHTELALFLTALFAVANLPFTLYLIKHWKNDMTISPAAQTIIDSLTTANTNLATALSNASSASSAQSAEDLAGITAAAQPLTDAIAAAATPPVAPETAGA